MALNTMNGLVRRTTMPAYAQGDSMQPSLTERGGLIHQQDLPERSELVRQGASYGAAIPTGSAFTFVNAWPTTRAELVLNNANSAGGNVLVIDRVWMTNITSQAAAQPFSILAQLRAGDCGVAAATDNAAVLRWQLGGKTTITTSGGGRLALANTAFALTNLWFILGNAAVSPMTTNLGNSMSVECYGRYIVPPGGAFCIAGLAGTAAGTAICGVEWHELALAI